MKDKQLRFSISSARFLFLSIHLALVGPLKNSYITNPISMSAILCYQCSVSKLLFYLN
uniref:Uncharacterized protein n=1 Tax=Arundo donax TaxID=35708 RepID=A0A0A9A643_ARUDO